MNFREAKTCTLRFGMYEGNTLDQIAETSRGLKYLDWLREQQERDEGGQYPETYASICCYLDDPTIARALESALRKGGGSR